MSYDKTFDVTIAERKNYSLVIAMCSPFPAGTFSASAQPRFSGSGTLVHNPSGQSLFTLPPANFFYYKAGEELATVAWNDSIGSFSSTRLPVIPLAVNYDISTGEASLVIPFGLSFSTALNEWEPGASPRQYRYTVAFTSGGTTYYLATGIIYVTNPPALGTNITVCHLRSGSQTGVETAAANPQTGMTGGNS